MKRGDIVGGIEAQTFGRGHTRRALGLVALLASLSSCADERGRGSGGPGIGGLGDEGCAAPEGQSCEVIECDDPCGYNEPGNVYDTNCVIPANEAECNDVRGVEVSFQQQGATVPAPGGFFKPKDPILEKWITARWQDQADMVVPANVMAMLTAGGTKVWNYPDGNGWTRTDFHAGIMALPKGDTPQTLLRAMADDIIKASGNDEFAGWVGWPKAGAGGRKVGDRVDLDLGPELGPVGYIRMDPDRFCVITLQNKTAGVHPVNGIRCWGFVPMAINPNWMATTSGEAMWKCAGPTYMFYTLGIDSPSYPGGGMASGVQASVWNALIRDLLQENDTKGGVSGRYYQQMTVTQPNALAPKSGVKVKGPGDRDSHYCTLPSDGYKDGDLCMDPAQGAAAGGCGEGEYTCSNGQCLPGEQRCDGVAQCVDRDDEDACDQADVDGCPANQFACNDGQCIPGEWKCDGEYEDCAAGEDESSCAAGDMGCKGDEFSCSDGQCIAGAWKCDGIDDCSDAGDEANCGGGGGGAACSPGEFTCDDGQCITSSWECDVYVDCADGSDEAYCSDGGGGGGGPSCSASEFTCDNGQCITGSWECDVYVDCADGSDEADCSDGGGGGSSCSASEFTCDNGACITGSWECDVYVDCSDGSDEAYC